MWMQHIFRHQQKYSSGRDDRLPNIHRWRDVLCAVKPTDRMVLDCQCSSRSKPCVLGMRRRINAALNERIGDQCCVVRSPMERCCRCKSVIPILRRTGLGRILRASRGSCVVSTLRLITGNRLICSSSRYRKCSSQGENRIYEQAGGDGASRDQIRSSLIQSCLHVPINSPLLDSSCEGASELFTPNPPHMASTTCHAMCVA